MNPVPKPRKRKKKPHSVMPKRQTSIRKRNPKRQRSEFARAYGSKERVEWIQGLPCVACLQSPCDNAHIESGGKGRKADADKIVPLCSDRVGDEGCHTELHRVGRYTFERIYRIDLKQEASEVESLWQSYTLSHTGSEKK